MVSAGQQPAESVITFPLRYRGYGRYLLRDALARNAKPGHWGFVALPPGGFRRNWLLPGYDPGAVDQFLAALASEAATAGLRPVPFKVRAARPRYRYGAEWKRYERACTAGWERLPGMPGVRLHLTSGPVSVTRRSIIWGSPPGLPSGRITSESEGIVLTPDGSPWTLAGHGLHYEQTSFDPPDTPWWAKTVAGYQLVDPGTGDVVVWAEGFHSARSAGGYVVLPGSRQFFMFPVSGTNERNAVMTAVTESGSQTLRFRRIAKDVTEIVVSPHCDSPPTCCA